MIFTTNFIYKNTNIKTINNNFKNSSMTIIYTDKNNLTHYSSYNINNQREQEIYRSKNSGFPNGSITYDEKNLYFSQKTSDLYYHIFKYDINSKRKRKRKRAIQLSIPDVNIDTFYITKDKLYMRVVQKNHHNFQLGIYNLLSKKLIICNKNDKDINILDFCFNKYTNKIYTIEYSYHEFLLSHLPKIPIHRIIEYDEDGNKIKDLYKMNVFLDYITVTKNGNNALVSGSTLTPYPFIYKIDFKTFKIVTLIKSNKYNIVKHPLYAPDGKGFYFLAITPISKTFITNTGESVETRGVYYYNFYSKEITKIFMKDNGTVRNYSIQY